MKGFKVISEAEDSYHIKHDNGKAFTVNKSGLSSKAKEAIQKLCGGGSVMKYAEGGEVVPEALAPSPVEAPAPVKPVAVPEVNLYEKPAAQTEDPNKKFSDFYDQSYNQQKQLTPGAPDDQVRAQALKLTQAYKDSSTTAAAGDQTNQQAENQKTAQENVQREKLGLKPLPMPFEVTETPQAAAQPMPASQPSAPQAVDPLVQNKMDVNSILDKKTGDVNSYISDISQAGAQTKNAYADLNNKLATLKTPEQIHQEYKAKDDALMQHFMDSQVDPNRYWNSKSTGSKILSAIGLALSGLGAGANGKNLALDHIQKSIDNDIDAQKNDMSKKATLWKMNRERMTSDEQATLATQNQYLTGVQAKIAMAGAQTQNAEAKLRASQMVQEIEMQKITNRRDLSLLDSGQQGSGGLIGADPTQILRGIEAPPEHVKKALEEVGVAQNVSKNRERILQAFDQASKETTGLKTGAGMLRESDGQVKLKQLMLPLFADVDGTVRQAAMDESFHNMVPNWSDLGGKKNARREALAGWLDSKQTGQTFRYLTGIPLNKFTSTSTDPGARFTPQEQKYYQWAKANPNSPVAKAFFEKKGIK